MTADRSHDGVTDRIAAIPDEYRCTQNCDAKETSGLGLSLHF